MVVLVVQVVLAEEAAKMVHLVAMESQDRVTLVHKQVAVAVLVLLQLAVAVALEDNFL